MTSAPDLTYYPSAPTGLRRPAIIAAATSAVALGVSLAFGHVLFGVFFGLGMLAIFGNAMLVRRAVDVITGQEHPRKQALALNSAGRLGAITVLALLVAFLVRPDGLGVMFGLAIGQVILVLSTVIPVMKGLRKQP